MMDTRAETISGGSSSQTVSHGKSAERKRHSRTRRIAWLAVFIASALFWLAVAWIFLG